MRAEEKAWELVQFFKGRGMDGNENYAVKECALKVVEEIINSNPHINPFNTDVYSTMKYWKEVKREIEKLT